jgi:hypothetical protein
MAAELCLNLMTCLCNEDATAGTGDLKVFRA